MSPWLLIEVGTRARTAHRGGVRWSGLKEPRPDATERAPRFATYRSSGRSV
jgi:hypothetical protein